MSDLAAAAEKLNVPEDILQRSAAARADASGTDTGAVLAAWAGGAAAPAGTPSGGAAPADPVPAAGESSAATDETETSEPTPAAEASTSSVETAEQSPAGMAEAPPGAVVVVEEPEPAAEPEPIGRRLTLAGRSGAVTGAVLALMAWVFSAQFFLSRATFFGEESARSAGIEAMTGRVVLGAILASIAIGVIVAGVARGIPAYLSRGMRLRTAPVYSSIVGGVVGLVVGALVGALIVGLGTPVETAEGVSNIPIIPAVIWSMLLWAGGGWLVGAAVQGAAVPEAVAEEDREEVQAVSRRLGSAFGVPVVAAVAILALVLSMAFVFISFPLFAPVTGVIAAGSILAFAAISASKPKMRIRKADVFVGVAGIAAVLIILLSLLLALGPEPGHGEGEAEESAIAEEVAE